MLILLFDKKFVPILFERIMINFVIISWIIL